MLSQKDYMDVAQAVANGLTRAKLDPEQCVFIARMIAIDLKVKGMLESEVADGIVNRCYTGQGIDNV